MTTEQLILAALLLAYFIFHSLTASLWMKQRVAHRHPQWMPYYRLTFNGVATLLIAPLFFYVLLNPGQLVWAWQGVWFYLVNGLAVLAVIGFIRSLKAYDMAEFWGTRQLAEHTTDVKDLESFQLSPFHRFVRHPWYFFLLVIIWTRDLYATQLVVYVMITLYLAVGSWLEEKKLAQYHGEVYEDYRKRVPGLVPLPWKYLSEKEARELLDAHYGLESKLHSSD